MNFFVVILKLSRFQKNMDKIKGAEDEIKTIKMLNFKFSKQITQLKILLDDDLETRATSIHGTRKIRRTYIIPQIIFFRGTKGKEAST